MLRTPASFLAPYFIRTASEGQTADAADKEEIIEERARHAKRGFGMLLILLATSAVTFFFGLGGLALVGPDEPRYAEVPREMVATGDYISPRLAGCFWFEKPVLQYWGSAAAYRLFGVSEFAARLPSAAAALVTTLTLFFTIRRLLSTQVAATASVVLLTMGIFIAYARIAGPDMALTISMALSILAGYLALTPESQGRLIYWVLCGASLGLAVLAKGLVAIVLVVGILALFLFIARPPRGLRLRDLLFAVLIFLLVAAVWYVPVTVKHGSAFIDKFFIEHHFERYLTNRHSHPQPVYFYIFVAIAGLMPWTFFLLPAAMRLRRLKPRSERLDSLLALAWVWFLLPLAFFSFSVSKLPGYLLPVFPALAIIVGVEVDQFLKRPERVHKVVGWLTCILLVALGVAFVVYARRQTIDGGGVRAALVWAPVAAALAASLLFAAKKRLAFVMGAVATVFGVIAGTVLLLFPGLNETKSLRSLSRHVAAQLRPDERTAFFLMKEFAPVFYADGRVVCGVGNGTLLNALHTDKLVEVLERRSSIVVFTTSNWVADLEGDPRISTELVGEQGNARAIRVTLRE